MKPVFRFAAAAWAVIVMLSGSVVTQEQPQEAPPDETVVREYKLPEFTSTQLRQIGAGEVQDVLSPDRSIGFEREWTPDLWSLRQSGHEARCWETESDALDEIARFCSFGDNWDLQQDDSPRERLVLSAPQSFHRRVDWVLGALRQLSRARINLRVYRLAGDAAPASPILSRAEAAALSARARVVGAATAGLGDAIVIQQSDALPYIGDHDVGSTCTGGLQPVTRTLRTGEEFVAGAVIMADGRVWMQGWYANRSAPPMRKLATPCGEVELPSISYGFTPVSACVENGGGAIVDCGAAGRFALLATVAGSVPNLSMDCGEGRVLRLFNVVGALRGFGLTTRWLMVPNHRERIEDAAFAQVILDEPEIDGPYNDAALMISRSLRHMGDVADVTVLGPLLGVKLAALTDLDTDALAARKEFLNAMESHGRSRASAAVRIRVLRVPAASPLPAALLLGQPAQVDIEQLGALPGCAAVMDRLCASDIEQGMDLLDLKIMAHVRSHDMRPHGETVLYDPEVRALLLGTQMRWTTRPGPDGTLTLDLRAGVCVGPEKFESVPVTLAGKEYCVERSRSHLVQAKFSADLDAGRSAAHVCPAAGDKDELLVLIATRLQ